MDLADLATLLRNLIVIALVVLALVGGVVYFDLASYTATGTEYLGADNATAKALIIYDPGIMGMGARAAAWMGHDLNTRGYDVNVSGVRARNVTNATGFAAVIVIAPTYFGGPPATVTEYLRQVEISPEARVGVYSVSGLTGDSAEGRMASELGNRSIAVRQRGNAGAWDSEAEEKAYVFVYGLLK